jgi:phosphoenolpyruvate synthase/pyruvate phosphate dikinase
MKYVINLTVCNDQKTIGSKTLNLSKLDKAGFNIASGFAITTLCYEYWEQNGVLPSTLRKEIEDKIEFNDLNYPFIIRSSATIEDSDKFSFAGIFTTLFDANSIETVVEKILQIYSDSKNAKVKAYCNQSQCKIEDVKMSIIIQEQMQPEYSGILFTRNPMNGEDETIIELTQGVPWKLVSGEGIAERIIIKNRNIEYNGKDYSLKTGLTEIPYTFIQELQITSMKIEKFFGYPQDIEWAIKEGQIFIFQSRPITTLNRNQLPTKIKGPQKLIAGNKKKKISLHGIPASLGSTQGKIQYIYDDIPVSEALTVFQKGNILGTYVLFQEHTPLLYQAGGIIAQTNVVNSHIGIVAREMQIPCVLGIDITKLYWYAHDFDEVIINADEGEVIILNPRASNISENVKRELISLKGTINEEGKEYIESLTQDIKLEDSSSFKIHFQEAKKYLEGLAADGSEFVVGLFAEINRLFEDGIIQILRAKYTDRQIIEKLIEFEKQSNKPTEGLQTIYFMIKEYLKNLNEKVINGKHFWEF